MIRTKNLIRLLKDAVLTGAGKALSGEHVLPDQISKAEAYRRYGRTHVDRWITERLITLNHKDQNTSKKYLDRKQLEAIATKSNRISYLPVAERRTR